MSKLYCERCDVEITGGEVFYTELLGWSVLCEHCGEEVVEEELEATRGCNSSDEEEFGYHEG